MKRILLPFLLFASSVNAHYEQIWIKHPQADVTYMCPRGYLLDTCIETACSYATPYSCRVIAQNGNTYFIETYIPPTYVSPVIVPSPVVIAPYPTFVVPSPVIVTPPVFPWFNRPTVPCQKHDYRHRPRRR